MSPSSKSTTLRNRRSSTGSIKNNTTNKDKVLCATAGANNWQTWAGRSHGSDQFEFLDIFRGVKRKFNAKFIWGIPPAGTACPVCLMVPDTHTKQDWHVTSACGHAVCRDCLHGYASSLVRDPSHQGPLKCPVCPLPLRPKDAISALASDPELIQLWDSKIRDGVLRALPGYRHCPRCNGGSNSSNNGDGDGGSNQKNPSTTIQSTYLTENTGTDESKPTSSLMGGGFVTPECLAPIHKSRETVALAWVDHPFVSQNFFMGLYLVYTYIYCGAFHSTSFYVDLIHITIIPTIVLHRLWHIVRNAIAVEARRTLVAPISVECPCCDNSFLLHAASELLGDNNRVIADQATEDWIGNNTRPCPSCSVPISKIDGCNHMCCGNCYAKFCWACMRVGSSCKAFNCGHGAPYGNAAGDDGDGEEQAHDEEGILGRIDRMEQLSTPWDMRRDGSAVAGLIISFCIRENAVVQWLAKTWIQSFAFLCTSGTLFAFLLGFVLYTLSVMLLQGRLRMRDVLDGRAAGEVVEELFNVEDTVERRMIRDAIQRSLVDQ